MVEVASETALRVTRAPLATRRNLLPPMRSYIAEVRVKGTVADMIRTIPKVQYQCASCGEYHDTRDMYFHDYIAGKISEGWNCYLCFPGSRSSPKAVSLEAFGEAIAIGLRGKQ